MLKSQVPLNQAAPETVAHLAGKQWVTSRGCANTTITVLRVPASVSEYGWMLENSHFVYMWTRESCFITGFWPIRFLNCIGVHKILNILECKHWWANEYFLCYGWNFLKRSILLLIHPCEGPCRCQWIWLDAGKKSLCLHVNPRKPFSNWFLTNQIS